ncbi:MAG: tRNA (adenosine(37)-N6)-threonylcarbamoyltransferase complex ATPase subunit type 1 TsaE [Bryobacterales bacterium]|nr:tRNA (adenosine(37)-N6)-threonylcarbamoyltransferase complex ATPase subunit type 1 TsaE [Bryobacterales bacterium]
MQPQSTSRQEGIWQAAGAEEMLALGRHLAGLLGPNAIVLLVGEMGAGKTTLAKGIVEGYGAGTAGDVSSPTFTLMHEYLGRSRVLHLDLYRLDTEAQVRAIGVDEWIDEVREADAAEPSLLLVEWGDRYPALWPEDRVEIHISVEEDIRRVQLRTAGAGHPGSPA